MKLIHLISSLSLLLLIVVGCSPKKTIPYPYPEKGKAYQDYLPAPRIEYDPRTYVCQRTPPLNLDGKLEESAWQTTVWTSEFVDIEGLAKPAPQHATAVKMLWDDNYFYIGAKLSEPHLWATLKNRDDIIFWDNDFEVFIDPNRDTHEYYELEMNALNTVWDLFLIKPYRDGGPALHNLDMAGLQTAVYLEGTLNDPSDIDSCWTVEIAIPWRVLAESAHCDSPPSSGDQWAVNFSRVQWRLSPNTGGYTKTVDSRTGSHYPEYNWVWSPQGLINMHYPEMWGLVQFSAAQAGTNAEEFDVSPEISARWYLRQVYYQQQNYYRRFGRYSPTLRNLGLQPYLGIDYDGPTVSGNHSHQFEVSLHASLGKSDLVIDHTGRIIRRSR